MLADTGYMPRNGTLAESTAVKRNPEISTELARINEAMDILEKCLADHHQRICPVLRQEPQGESVRGASTADEHRSSTVGAALEQIRYKIERVTGALNGMSLQIEL